MTLVLMQHFSVTTHSSHRLISSNPLISATSKVTATVWEHQLFLNKLQYLWQALPTEFTITNHCLNMLMATD